MRPALAALVVLLSGCATSGDLYRSAPRGPDLMPDRRDAVDLRREVDAYVRGVAEAVGLDADAERQVAELLEDRAYVYLSRGAYGAAFPFPRSPYASNAVKAWWAETDTAIEAGLAPSQRGAYRRFVASFAAPGRDGDPAP